MFYKCIIDSTVSVAVWKLCAKSEKVNFALSLRLNHAKEGLWGAPYHLIARNPSPGRRLLAFFENECGTSSAMTTAAASASASFSYSYSSCFASNFPLWKPASRQQVKHCRATCHNHLVAPLSCCIILFTALHYARADEMTTLDAGIKCCLCCTTFIGFDKAENVGQVARQIASCGFDPSQACCECINFYARFRMLLIIGMVATWCRFPWVPLHISGQRPLFRWFLVGIRTAHIG